MAADDARSAPPVVWWEWAGLAVCAPIFVLLRLPLYTHPGILLGWHSDAALLGLMARSIVAGDIPWLFWGADYLAPLTSVFAAGVGALLGDVGPLALRLGTAIEFFAALVFLHAGLRRVVGRRASLLTAFWLAAGPPFFFKLTYAPLSAELYFFLGAILFWYTVRAPFDRAHRWLIFGLLTGAGWWIHRGTMFVVIPALVTIAVYDRQRLRRWQLATSAVIFAAGAILGYAPAILGRYAIDQRLYTPIQPPWTFQHVATRLVETLTSDLWLLLGGWLAGALLVVLLAGAARHFRLSRDTVLTAGIVATCFAFWVGSTQAYGGAVRYLMIALPMLCAFAAREIIRLWDAAITSRRIAAATLVAIVTLAYYVPAYQQAHEVALAHREVFENWGGFDPRPALDALRAGGYTVCYADVWVAHKLEWLSQPTVHVIPYRSVNRRMTESLRLAGTPGRKCFVDSAGNIRPLTSQEETQFRLETLRLIQGR